MTDSEKGNDQRPATDGVGAGGTGELLPGLVGAVVEALDGGQGEQVKALVRPLHYADLADLLESLSAEQRRGLVEVIRGDFTAEILSELDETVRDEILEQLSVKDLAAALTELETDDAVEVIRDLDDVDKHEVLQALPADERTLIEESLTFPEDSAGRLMQRELVTVPQSWTVGETIDFMRQTADQDTNTLPEVFYDIFVVDDGRRPVGAIPLSRLLRNRRPVAVREIMETEMKRIPVTMDQEEVAFLFRQRDLVSAPVVDRNGRLVGAITIDDVVDVIDEEAEEDLLRLGGVGESDIHASPLVTVRRRQSWLVVTLVNTIIASVVIFQFEASIEKLVALAVLMPIVAAMGGNAGMQVVTVVVRSLATKELTSTNVVRVIGKELLVGAMNGVVFAAIMATIAGFWFADVGLGLVLASAMIFNMVWAGFAGTVIPLTLSRLGIDPAVAAGPFLTTTTDVFGFFVFLGLAAWLLL